MPEHLIICGHPPQRHTDIDLLNASRTTLGASAAGGATPYIFAFYLGQAKGGFPYDLANTELPYPVPRAHRIAQTTLKAKPEGISAGLFYLLGYFFEGSDCFHCFY